MNALRKIQGGFSLFAAIFLLVVIAALAQVAVTLSTAQHQSSTLDVVGARAYQAARAGIEWGVFQVLDATSNAAINTPGGMDCTGLNNAVAMPASTTLASFAVNVTCTRTAAIDSGSNFFIYQLVSTAVTSSAAAGTPNYVERELTVTLTDNAAP